MQKALASCQINLEIEYFASPGDIRFLQLIALFYTQDRKLLECFRIVKETIDEESDVFSEACQRLVASDFDSFSLSLFHLANSKLFM